MAKSLSPVMRLHCLRSTDLIPGLLRKLFRSVNLFWKYFANY